MASIFRTKEYQSQTDAGAPLSGGYLEFLITTTTTPKTAYPTEADAIAGTNGFTTRTLDADGRCATEVWLVGRYRVRTYTSSGGTLIADDDPIEDSVPASALQTSATTYGGNNSGTADALAFTFSPALTAYTNGAPLRGRITADNTGAVTINCDGLGVKSLVKRDGRAMRAGDLQGPDILEFYFDSATDAFRLGNPCGPNIRTDVAPSAGVVTLTGYTNVRVTGTSAVTGFTIPDGEACDCVTSAALPITAGASLLIQGVSSGSTITLAAGDTFRVRGEASSVSRVYGLGTGGLLATTSASAAAQVDFALPAGYRRYEIHYDTIVSNDGAELYCRVSQDSGSSFLAANYKWASGEADSGGTHTATGSASDAQITIALNVGSAVTEGSDGVVRISNPASTTRYKNVAFDTVTNDDTAGFLNKRRTGCGAYVGDAAAVNAIRILPSAGTITGTFKLYGFA